MNGYRNFVQSNAAPQKRKDRDCFLDWYIVQTVGVNYTSPLVRVLTVHKTITAVQSIKAIREAVRHTLSARTYFLISSTSFSDKNRCVAFTNFSHTATSCSISDGVVSATSKMFIYPSVSQTASSISVDQSCHPRILSIALLTPSSSLAAVMNRACFLTSSCALPIAIPRPAYRIMSRSLSPSPMAIISSRRMP